MSLTAAELLDLAYQQQLNEELNSKPKVYGLSDVHNGLHTLIPLTIYNISDDDRSGIAGLLMPDGTFIPTKPATRFVKYWEFDETFKYEQVTNPNTGKVNVVGNSWAEGEVTWNGVNSYNFRNTHINEFPEAA